MADVQAADRMGWFPQLTCVEVERSSQSSVWVAAAAVLGVHSFHFSVFHHIQTQFNLMIIIFEENVSKFGSILFSPPPPPLRVFYDPQLQIICRYIARYYVRK